MNALLGRFALDAVGSTAIEYGFIGGLVLLAVVASVNAFSAEFHALFSRVETAVTNVDP